MNTLYFILILIPVILSFFLMRKEMASLSKGGTDEALLRGNLFWYVFVLCFLAPVFSQAIFYYGWKKRAPQKAEKAKWLGWVAMLIWLILYIPLYLTGNI